MYIGQKRICLRKTLKNGRIEIEIHLLKGGTSFMFKEKDYVRYGSRGIFQVEQIIKKELKPRHPETCYVLSSVYGIHTQIVTPASNPQLRRVMNREEIDRMIDEMPLLESDWIDDKRKREETYRAILEEGNGRKLAQLIVSIYSQKQDKLKDRKSLSRTDAEMLERAEDLLHEEISLSYKIKKEEVADYLLSRLKDK